MKNNLPLCISDFGSIGRLSCSSERSTDLHLTRFSMPSETHLMLLSFRLHQTKTAFAKKAPHKLFSMSLGRWSRSMLTSPSPLVSANRTALPPMTTYAAFFESIFRAFEWCGHWFKKKWFLFAGPTCSLRTITTRLPCSPFCTLDLRQSLSIPPRDGCISKVISRALGRCHRSQEIIFFLACTSLTSCSVGLTPRLLSLEVPALFKLNPTSICHEKGLLELSIDGIIYSHLSFFHFLVMEGGMRDFDWSLH